MRILLGVLAGLTMLVSCDLPTAPAGGNNNTATGPLIKADINDGSGSFSVHGSTTVTATVPAGTVQVDIFGIETAAPNRQIRIQILSVPLTSVGVAVALNSPNISDGGGSGVYSGSLSTQPYAISTTTSGSITFDNLATGSNNISGSFSFTAVRPTDGATVSVTNGTFGK